MPDKLFISDERMLKLMEYTVKHQVQGICNEYEYWQKIGFARTNLSNVRVGKQSFTKEHILRACEFTGANANWIFGLEKKMFRDEKGKDPLQLLREAVAGVEDVLETKAKNKQAIARQKS